MSKLLYNDIYKAEFISRPNRFIATVRIGADIKTVHVKNTGRCKELLIKGTAVYLEKSNKENRKTEYDLVAVEKKTKNGKMLINIDSFAPNIAVEKWLKEGGLFGENAIVRREVTYKNSRFDFFVEKGNQKTFVEVKGVTLENEGVALFPDAPTERGIKHINELIKAKREGYNAYIIFVIQMKGVKLFKPNYETHSAFGELLKGAKDAGVNILAIDCIVTKDNMIIDKKVELEIE